MPSLLLHNTHYYCVPDVYLLPIAREGNVFTGVCQSFCSQSASWLLGHCSSLLRRGRYASYWKAFLCKFLSSETTKIQFCNCRTAPTDFLKSNVQFHTVLILLFIFRLGFLVVRMLSANYNLENNFNLVCLWLLLQVVRAWNN